MVVPLSAVGETYIQAAWPGKAIAVVAVPNEKKGEQLGSFHRYDEVTREAVQERARTQKLTELMVLSDQRQNRPIAGSRHRQDGLCKSCLNTLARSAT